MKDITLNITEVQYHYLKSLAEAEVRSVEQLLYILLHKGAEWHFMESDISLEVLPHDYTKHEQEQYMDPERITTIRRTCLLYTSPSPRDVEESRMPSSA